MIPISFPGDLGLSRYNPVPIKVLEKRGKQSRVEQHSGKKICADFGILANRAGSPKMKPGKDSSSGKKDKARLDQQDPYS